MVRFLGVKEVCFSSHSQTDSSVKLAPKNPNLKIEIISEIMLEIHKLKFAYKHTVGWWFRNPKQPPGIYKTLYIIGINYLLTGAGFSSINSIILAPIQLLMNIEDY